MSDRLLRRILFRNILVGSGLFLALGWGAGLTLESTIDQSSDVVPFGTYGFPLANLVPDPDRPTIILLGNSVYHVHEIVPRMQALAEGEGRNWQFLNAAVTGSTIADLLVQTASLVQHDPALIVITMHPWTFDARSPVFHTNVDQMLMDGAIRPLMPRRFLYRHFDRTRLAEIAAGRLVTFSRYDPVLRHQLRIDRVVPTWFADRIGLPILNARGQLNMMGQWRRNNPAYWDVKPYAHDDSATTLLELVRLADDAEVPLLIIWQEFESDQPNVLPLIQAAVDRSPLAKVVDLRSYWNPREFRDKVHPKEHERDSYARRHYENVAEAFGFLVRDGQD
jgi:hypothetical protein